MDLQDIVALVRSQERDEILWNDKESLKRALQQLHSSVLKTIDLSKLKRTFCRFYGDGVIKLKIHNTVFTDLKADDLDVLASPGSIEFREKLKESIEKHGLKGPFCIHYVTNVPIGNRHGCLIKTGNNRIRVIKEMGIETVPCVVVNLSGDCFGQGNWNKPFIEGEILRNEADVRKHFHTPKVHVTFRDGMIVNCYTPYFMRIQSDYTREKEELKVKERVKKL
jgi:hypothetical protein